MTRLVQGVRWVGLFATALCVLEARAFSASFKATLGNIVDGDTVHVVDAKGKWHKIRFLGMDTPELHFNNKAQDPWGQQATDRLHEILNATPAKLNSSHRVDVKCKDRTTGKEIEVEIQTEGQDKYKRDLGYVLFQGKNINLELVKEGWAFPYLYCAKKACAADFEKKAMVKDFVSACLTARKAKKGMFNSRNPIDETPSEFRRRIDGRPAYQFIGDYDTKHLYEPRNESKVDACQRIRFDNEEDAALVGYKP